MLTASKILEELNNEKIGIYPFDIKNLNPNSYNVRLSPTLMIYDIDPLTPLDPNKHNPTKTITIPEEGYILQPGVLYLGSTKEIISSDYYISAIDGRSSIGRLGISIHATAGFGDVGFKGTYTLEISCIHPVKIYPDMLIAQIHFTEPCGDTDFLYRGRYYEQIDPTESRMFMNESQLSDNYHYKKEVKNDNN